MLPIAVEIAPPDARPEDVAALLTACTRAVAPSECVLAAEAPEGGALAVAIVTWQNDGQAFVEVGMRREGRPEWRSRGVNFAAEDERVERWRTVGFVVGTLARSELSGEPVPEEKPKPEPPRTPPAAPPAAPRPQRDPHSPVSKPPVRAAIDVGGELGPGLASGWRTGGVLRTRWPFQDPLRLLISLKYLEQNGSTPDGRWLTLGAGLGWVHGSAQTEVAGGAEGRIEYFQATYEKYYAATPAGVNARDSRWVAGLGLHASAAWMPMPAFGLYVAGDAAWMFGSTRVHLPDVDGKPQVVTDGALRFGVGAGVRLRLW
jgi:hypothetical protein